MEDGYFCLDMLKVVLLCPNSIEVNQFPDGEKKQIFIKNSCTYFTSIYPFQIYIYSFGEFSPAPAVYSISIYPIYIYKL